MKTLETKIKLRDLFLLIAKEEYKIEKLR